MTSSSVFIYGLWDPRNSELRYIGKSNDPKKRFKDHLKEARGKRRNSHVHNWIRQLLLENLTPSLEILEEVSADLWQEAERGWIRDAKLLGLRLTNRTDGGEGVSDYTNQEREISEQHRLHLSQALKGRIFTEEHKRNISLSHKGKNLGNKFALGYRHTPETKRKISEVSKRSSSKPWQGKHLSEEHKRKLSEAGKGRIFSEESRRKISQALRGRVFSEETRMKLRISMKRRYAKKREQ